MLRWKDTSGSTAREAAAQRGREDMVRLLDYAMGMGELWERRVLGVTIGLAAADSRTGRRRATPAEKKRKVVQW